MTATRPIRFGLQLTPTVDTIDTIGPAAEAAGFEVLSVADHVGPTPASPLISLARLAASTESVRLGTMVLNNDMRNPVQLAWEVATLQQLSGGRFEVGLGAGHTPQEYAATGIGLDEPRVRKERLAESVELLGALFAGGPVDHRGTHYHVEGAELPPVDRPPILVGGNGTRLLSHAAVNADIIGLQGLGRTRADGHRHEVKWSVDHLEAQLTTIEAAAGPTGRRPELQALVQAVVITDDRERALHEFVERAPSLSMDEAAATPYLAIGTVDEIAEQFVANNRRWGLSYLTVREPDLGAVISRVRELEAAGS